MAKNVLKAWPVDTTVTTDDKTNKIISLKTTHSIAKGNHTGSHGGKESWRAVRDDGEYTHTVTTQYRGGGGDLLKTPRSTSHTINIGKAPVVSGSTEKPVGSDGDSDDSPMD